MNDDRELIFPHIVRSLIGKDGERRYWLELHDEPPKKLTKRLFDPEYPLRFVRSKGDRQDLWGPLKEGLFPTNEDHALPASELIRILNEYVHDPKSLPFRKIDYEERERELENRRSHEMLEAAFHQYGLFEPMDSYLLEEYRKDPRSMNRPDEKRDPRDSRRV